MKPDLSTLGKRLAYARELRGFRTQQELADRASVSQSTIGNLESDAREKPRSLLQIASALGVSAVWLQYGTGDMDVADPRLRPDVSDLAQLVQKQLNEDQVATLRQMVIALSGGVDDAPPAGRKRR